MSAFLALPPLPVAVGLKEHDVDIKAVHIIMSIGLDHPAMDVRMWPEGDLWPRIEFEGDFLPASSWLKGRLPDLLFRRHLVAPYTIVFKSPGEHLSIDYGPLDMGRCDYGVSDFWNCVLDIDEEMKRLVSRARPAMRVLYRGRTAPGITLLLVACSGVHCSVHQQ